VTARTTGAGAPGGGAGQARAPARRAWALATGTAAGRLVAAVVVIAVLLALDRVLSSVLNPYLFRVLMLCGINIVLAVSLNLINGFAGQFSIGHAGFMAVGGYAAAALTTYLGPRILAALAALGLAGAAGTSVLFVAALLFGGLLAAAAGLLVGIPSLRLRGDYLAIVTLGFGEIIRVVILNLDFLGGARGFPGIPRYTSFFWVALFVLVVILVVRNLVNSSYGLAFLMVRDDETAAAAMGVDTTRFKVMAFVIGAFFAGIAGGLFAHYLIYLHTNSFTFMKSFEIVIMVVLGGMGSIIGSVLAAILLTVLPELLRTVQQYRMVFYSALLIVLMLTRPQGIFGSGAPAPARWLRRRRKEARDAA
jgi:branched-chain amino acid transport system permease protein